MQTKRTMKQTTISALEGTGKNEHNSKAFESLNSVQKTYGACVCVVQVHRVVKQWSVNTDTSHSKRQRTFLLPPKIERKVQRTVESMIKSA